MASEPTVDNSDERTVTTDTDTAATDTDATDTGTTEPVTTGPDVTDAGASDAGAPDTGDSDTGASDTVADADAAGDAPAPAKRATRKRASSSTAKKTATRARKSAAKQAPADAEAPPAPEDEPGSTDPDGADPTAESDAAESDAAEFDAGRSDTESPAPARRARRTRKATTAAQQPAASEPDEAPETDETDDSVATDNDDTASTDEASTDEAEPTTPVPTFGLVFKAPEPVTPRRRRATSAAGAPSPRPEQDEPSGSAGTDDTGTDSGADTDSTQPGTGEGSTSAEDTGEGGSRRSRRRGGRGRRTRTGDAGSGDQSPTQDATGAAEGDSGTGDQDSGDGSERPSGTDAVDSTDESSTSSRRRRRRRRGTSADSDESRGARAREEVTALRGSTRLEAKKQRRREGREAGRRRQIITEAEFLARRESVERVMVVRELEGKTQIGVLEDDVLVEHYVSRETGASMIGNVYLGRVQNVLPSMEAAFVDIGKGRNAVLYAGEVNWDAAGLEGNVPKRIENALTSGDTVLVQVTKDPIGHKGARLTSQVSLPGRFLVYVPEASMTGISRKLPDTERNRLKGILKRIVPDDAGVIVRTAAEGASEEELTADIERLTKAWERITTKAEKAGKRKGGAPALLHGEPDLTVKVIRDVFNEDFTSLVVAGEKAWTEVSDYLEDVAPDLAQRLTKWTGEKDLFTQYRVDEQLAKALDRKVWLPSGGSLVIDRTEAMTVVDVNTGKFVGSGGNLEETVTKNNIEAAEEIVRQLRLRDIGGIIVIDFIDMVLESNRDLVVRRLLECLGRDRTKHQVAEVTSLGLVQMTRKRVGSGLLEVFSEPCSHCNGRGLIVHSTPVDQQAGDDTSGGTGRGRGRGRGGSGSSSGNGSGRGGRGNGSSEPENNGPTAAQIAAAAHAAALKAVAAASSMPEAGVTPEDAGSEAEATDSADTAVDSTADTSPDTGADASDESTSPQATESAERAESADETEPTDEAEATDQAESTTAAEPTEQPEPATETQPTAAVTSSAEAAPHTRSSDSAPAEATPPPRRRRRGRVVAPAGPPGQAQVRVLTDETDQTDD